MKIVSVANQKGGVGKTTVLVTLATLAAQMGNKVLVVDIDPQESAKFWLEQVEASYEDRRNGQGLPFDFTATTDLRALATLRARDEWDIIFVDTPGSLEGKDALSTVVRQSDFIIAPSEASALSLPPLIRTLKELVLPHGVPYRVLLNRVRSATAAEESRQVLEAAGVQVFTNTMREYTVHSRAPLEGKLITEYPRSHKEAISDAQLIAGEMFSIFTRDAATSTRAEVSA